MAVSVLLKSKPPVIDEIELDVAESEVHDYQSMVTGFPVEDGSDISDHVVNEPARLTIEGFVTNSPIRTTEGLATSDETRSDGVGTRAITAFNALLKIRDNKQPVTIFTNLKSYENMVLEALSVPKTNNTGDALRFSSSWVQITKVKSKTVLTANLAKNTTGAKAGTSDVAAGETNLGKQNAKGSKKTSWVKSLAKSFTSAGG